MSKFSGIKNLIKSMSIDDIMKANEAAEAAGLNKAVFHGTKFDKPFDVIDKNKLADGLFHVAPNAKIPTQRLKDINATSGTIMPLRAKIENPLEVPDLGAWGADDILGDLTLSKMMDSREKAKMGKLKDLLSKNTDDYINNFEPTFDNKPVPKLDRLLKEGKQLEHNKVDALHDIISKRGYDALKYKNTVEIPVDKRLALKDLENKIAKATSTAESDALNNQYLRILNNDANTSYALFPDKTPVRSLSAGFKDVSIKPSHLLYGTAAAAMAGNTSQAAQDKPDRFKQLQSLLSQDTMETLSEPSVMDEYIKKTDEEQYNKIQQAKRMRDAIGLAEGAIGNVATIK